MQADGKLPHGHAVSRGPSATRELLVNGLDLSPALSSYV